MCLLAVGLESDVAPTSSTATTQPHSPLPTQIGPYRVLDRLGEGGMGLVYLAEQTQPIRRKVAIKVIKPGMDSKQVLARFEAERQALAVMNHPNIAKIYDVGTIDGRPYVVMEYVPGLPITQYADLKCLSIRERNDLFVQVCQAVQHAHQKGVIHRDIKPSNILVSSDDGAAVMKVIDFGLAKATGQPLTDRSLVTLDGIVVGTPEYMSPEQAGGLSLDVDARTDVYALGVLLYELLVGARPFDGRMLRTAAAAEMLRIIREEEPPSLVKKLSGFGEATTEVARLRGTDAGQLSRQLKGDLEWITARALDKNPDRRYASASELAADVRRHQADEPVMAGPPGLRYRAGRFARKHRSAVIGAAASLAILVAALAVTGGLYVRSEGLRRRAELEAKRNALEARASLLARVGDLGAYSRLSTEALALHRAALGPGNVDLVPFLVNRLAEFEFAGGKDPQAETALRQEALALIDRAILENSEGTLEAVALMVKVLSPEEAAPIARKALAMPRRAAADERAAELEEQLLMSVERGAANSPVPADDESLEGTYRRVLARRRAVLSVGSPALVNTQRALAATLRRKAQRLMGDQQLEPAARTFPELTALLAEPGVDFDEALEHARFAFGMCLLGLGRHADAERELLAAKALVDAVPGHATASMQQVLNGLADLYGATNRPAEAARTRALLPAISVAAAADLGPLRFDLPAKYRDGGASAPIEGRGSLWIFGPVGLFGPPGERPIDRQADIAWADAPIAPAAIVLRHGRPSGAVPEDVLALTPGEAAFNRGQGPAPCVAPCGATYYYLRPTSAVASARSDRAVVFYQRQLVTPLGHEQPAGTSFCEIRPPWAQCDRTIVGSDGAEPTILFGANEPAWGSAALVDGADLYAYACGCRSGFDCGCRVARAPLGRAANRSAWLFYQGGGRWGEDWRPAVRVLDEPWEDMTVHWSAFLKKFVAIWSRPLSTRVRVAIADRPEGPWSAPITEIQTARSEGQWDWSRDAKGHQELARGDAEYITVRRNVGFTSERRLMEVRFRKK